MTEDHEGPDQTRAAYDVHATEAKWLPVWEKLDPFRADDDSPREKRYALTMFPYPSGDLHMGHAEVTALHDVIARYWRQQGYEVMNPIGWDSFGLPAENAAIQRNEHPATYTYANIETQAASFKKFAVSFDWSRRLHTSDPEYYRWTQWLFLKLRERGLAYRKSSPVNWCPNDQTVLANEQVVDGRCERCGAEVTKRELTQWYFRITDYAQELLDDLDVLEPTWPGRVVTAQRNWIGRSEGAHVDFEVDRGGGTTSRSRSTRPVRTPCSARRSWWSRPTRSWRREIVSDEQRTAYEAYLEETRKASEIDRLSTERPKTGVFLGTYAVNPVNGAARAGVGRRLRAGRLRHRRDHGRARAGPARLGLRRRRTTCRSCGPCSRPRASRARRSPATVRRSTPPTTRCRWTAWRSTRPSARSSTTWSSRGPAAAR